ncbi:MAG: GNAT family N-acetyltransferase [Treponema sp.]|nr:GNAT family N-acetyltransferase [Treponema sp.]
MNIKIRKTTKNEFDEVIKLTWETFLEFEAPDYDINGINQFKKDIIDNASFKEACISERNKTFGAFDSNVLVGIIVIRNENHITLFFVKKEYQRKGIATQLFYKFVEEFKNIVKKEN